MKGFFILGLCVSPAVFFAQAKNDSIAESNIQEVRLLKRLPVAKEIINVQKDLAQKNLGQDLPILLKNQTSVVTTSDAGNGVGYTGFRIRGVAGNGINVMMNGVPYNDSESQGTFFVDVPDLASSASQIVIQRGVGTSTNGVSAFGASVNVISRNPDEKFSVKTDDSYGSFNTYKYGAEINSGKFWKNRLSMTGRYTKIHSDGYIDRAFSNLDSYNFTALFEENKTKIRLMAFGGKEKTYQAWNGISVERWQTNPRYNPSGKYTDLATGEVKFYGNETDNYRQNHYQLLWNQYFNSNWTLETTLHYTKGKGYYENYKQVDMNDDWAPKYSDFDLPTPIVNGLPVTASDFIRRKWLDNDFYGIVSTLYGKLDNVDLNFGLVGNQYYGRHYGNVTGVQLPQIVEHEFYRNNGVKNEIAGFAKAIYKMDRVEFFGDLQLRNIGYKTSVAMAGDDVTPLDKNWLFFNPKAGVNFLIPQGKVFVSYAHAHREPNREDLLANPETKAEKLHDFEAGFEKSFGNFQLTANAYYMDYKNQLVLTGLINDVGDYIRQNVDKSYRLGLEIGAVANVSKALAFNANLTLSKNRIDALNSEAGSQTVVLRDTNISFSPNILANLGVHVKPTDNFSLGLQNQYVGTQYLDNTNNENLRLKDYFLTDFNASYGLKLRNFDADFKFLLNNIFDRKYVSNGYVYGGAPYVFSQAGINFMFGASISFH